MRFRRIRRALGPFEPVLHAQYRRLRAWRLRRSRTAVVVIATDADHVAEAADLVEAVADDLGVWFTAAVDVVPYGTHGWFVVRLEPESWTDREIERRLEQVRGHRRVRRVIDLRDQDVATGSR